MADGHLSCSPRVFDLAGPVLDIGCLGWDWSKQFGGRKRVVGFDPQEETEPEWAELRTEAVSIADGTMTWRRLETEIAVAHLVTGAFTAGSELLEVSAVSFSSILKEYSPSLIKMNIEGMEYSLLSSVQHPIADQLVVSFHGFMDKRWTGLDERYVDWLSEWYEPLETCREWGWWMFLERL